MRFKHYSLWLAPLLAFSLAAGCTEKQEDAAESGADTAVNAAANATEGTADATGNAAITGKIKSALIAEPSVGALSINVDTAGDAVVTLTGDVETEAQKKKAEEIAVANGAKAVTNNLVVKPAS